ncbi:MAG: MFS transporter [Cyclobacteriaceae bacterium]
MSTANTSTKKRYNILVMIFVTVVINYLDRTNISVAASAIRESLEFSTVQMGLIFSAFGWTYATLQIPGGIMVDRVKTRVLYSSILFLWSIATLFQGMVNSFAAFIGLRMSIGVFEAPSYPTNNAVVTRWFPEKERARAIAIYTSGQFMGLAFLFPALAAVQAWIGWRGLLITSGVIGIIWAVIWYIFYRDPADHKSVSQDELDYIKEGGGVSIARKDQPKFDWSDLAMAFKFRKLWGVYIGQFCLGSVTIFFLTWFPNYLVEYRGLDFIKSGFLTSLPFLAAFVGVLFSGFLSDGLLKRGYSAGIARKVPVLTGLLLSMAIVGANFTDDTTYIIVSMAIAFFGNGLASIGWIFVSSLAPKHLIGLVGGVFNFVGGLSAIVVPTAIGFLVQDGDFAPALFFIGALTLLGFFSYLILVGKVERIEVDTSSKAEV